MDINYWKEVILNKVYGYLWIPIWLCLFIIYLIKGDTILLGSIGINKLGGHSLFRLFSGIFFHKNLIHLLVNVLAYFWIAHYLLKIVSGFKIFIFALVVAIIEESILSLIYPELENGYGGSSITFALIGLILTFQIIKKGIVAINISNVHKNNGDGIVNMGLIERRWIALYAILTNIPIVMIGPMTILTHILALLVGLVLGIVGVNYFYMI